jgi:hypothetical protein
VAEFLQYVATPGNEKIIIIKRKTVKHVYTGKQMYLTSRLFVHCNCNFSTVYIDKMRFN